MATQVMQLLECYFRSEGPESLNVHPTWITPLVRFLSLYGGFHTEDSLSTARYIILRILSTFPAPPDFNATILPLLILALSPTHPLQLRHPALQFILGSMHQWLITEDVPDTDLNDLLTAVGDPFESTLELDDGLSIGATRYDPMMIVATLIGFALSDQWCGHVHSTNFITCEDMVSTEEGNIAFRHALDMTSPAWPVFLLRSKNLDRALARLKGLGCPETAQALDAWVSGPRRWIMRKCRWLSKKLYTVLNVFPEPLKGIIWIPTIALGHYTMDFG